MTKLSMEWKRLCKIKAKVRVNTEESAVKPEPELKNTIECNGPGKPNKMRSDMRVRIAWGELCTSQHTTSHELSRLETSIKESWYHQKRQKTKPKMTNSEHGMGKDLWQIKAKSKNVKVSVNTEESSSLTEPEHGRIYDAIFNH
ncbi:hypothetical protein Tco_1030174 [Tanacetum coccineum]|uniref:Uncharacterized protein n=1 Tax=Tanacetum coccineum TaxID=301880 RepID=A0ABQ5G5H7_9ASTR